MARLAQADDALIARLLGQFDWRSRTAGAYLAALTERPAFADQLGGLLHAIVALGSGSMFSFVYLRYRTPGVALAYATTTFSRACNNTAVLVAVFYGLDV